jgi:microcystin-dependent protein
MKRIIITVAAIATVMAAQAQNVGINTTTPQATLDVNGTTRTNSLTVTGGGNQSDFLVKSNANGQVGFRKGHGAVAGIRYMICTAGIFPFQGMQIGPDPYVGEIRMCVLLDSTRIPVGWVLCEGQVLPINQNTALYSLIGSGFGGDGVTTFALPDLRGAAPLGPGNGWLFGQKSNQ